MDQQVQLSWMDVPAKEALTFWKRVPHSVLLFVRHSLSNGVGRRHRFPISNHPKVQQPRDLVGLLLRLLEPSFAKGMVVILDSGFYVLRGIIELKKCGFYASTLKKM